MEPVHIRHGATDRNLKQTGLTIEYEMACIDGGVPFSQYVLFIFDDDGIWRIKFIYSGLFAKGRQDFSHGRSASLAWGGSVCRSTGITL